MGPLLFILYTATLGDILRAHNILYHLYADDTQLYLTFDVSEISDAIKSLELCVQDIRAWMAENFLCLNDNKTELIIFGKTNNMKSIPQIQVQVGGEMIKTTDCVRNIGAHFDSFSQCPPMSTRCQKVHGIS